MGLYSGHMRLSVQGVPILNLLQLNGSDNPFDPASCADYHYVVVANFKFAPNSPGNTSAAGRVRACALGR
jgi:hypothetical protein